MAPATTISSKDKKRKKFKIIFGLKLTAADLDADEKSYYDK